MCLYPRLLHNPKYKPNKKNLGKVPHLVDKRALAVPVGCGKCIECTKQKARNWQIRLLEEIKQHKNGKFVTLTFNNESFKQLAEENKDLTGYELDNAIATLATRRFLERWRKEHKKSVRHWLITELGHNGTENIHLHGIIWTHESFDKIAQHWKYGFINSEHYRKHNFVNERTVNYIIKYVTKRDFVHQEYQPKILTSKGIGSGYINSHNFNRNKYNGTETKDVYKTHTGHEIALPIYYRNKIYSDQEREQLWMQKLDKNERWVCGERVQGGATEEYFELVKWHRVRNKQLGYGDITPDWERKEYEEQRRKMLHEQRNTNT